MSFVLTAKDHNLSKNNTFMGTTYPFAPRKVWLLYQWFNFPIIGACWKNCRYFCYGMPAIVKPRATVTSYLTEAVVKEIIASKYCLGPLQLICGSAGDLLNHVNSRDVLPSPVLHLPGLVRRQNKHIQNTVPFNMGRFTQLVLCWDKRNAWNTGWEIFIKRNRKEMTLKAGQR